MSTKEIKLLSGFVYGSASIIRAGVIPTIPSKHLAGISIRTVALYHWLFVYCPKLGIQPFVKSLCDAEGAAFKPYMSTQMSTVFDLYIAILNGVRTCVQKMLDQEGPTWCVLNCCPACQYCLEGEEELEVRMLSCIDGNDSLRCMERQEASTLDPSAEPNAPLTVAPSKAPVTVILKA